MHEPATNIPKHTGAQNTERGELLGCLTSGHWVAGLWAAGLLLSRSRVLGYPGGVECFDLRAFISPYSSRTYPLRAGEGPRGRGVEGLRTAGCPT